MKVAAIQMVSTPSVRENLRAARSLLERAAEEGCELAVLPEYFCLMGRRDADKLDHREAAGDGPIQDFLARSARELGLWVVGGTLPLRTADPARVRNTTLVFSPQGRQVARYDKIHLFRFDNGRERFDEAGQFELCGATTGLTVGDRHLGGDLRRGGGFDVGDSLVEQRLLGVDRCEDLISGHGLISCYQGASNREATATIGISTAAVGVVVLSRKYQMPGASSTVNSHR